MKFIRRGSAPEFTPDAHVHVLLRSRGRWYSAVTIVTRSLDDLDRLAFRLSRTVRTQYPHLLSQGFTLTDLEERLLPFRDVRQEMANGGPETFETSLLRLIAGERDYVRTEAALQHACRRALASSSPTVAMVRHWATSIVRLNQAGASPDLGDLEPAFPFTAAATFAPAPCCRYCDNSLPVGRHVTFCPHCGLDLTKRQCPACSAELETQWRFCVTCGRNG